MTVKQRPASTSESRVDGRRRARLIDQRMAALEANTGRGRTSIARAETANLLDLKWALTPHETPEVCFAIITQPIAEKILENARPHNRPVSNDRQLRWTQILEEDHYVVTHQGLGFDTNGAYIDGQHRLRTIAATGIPMLTEVTVGLDVRAWAATDAGYARTAANMLAGEGFTYGGTHAAAIRLVRCYRSQLPVSQWKRRVFVDTETILNDTKRDPDGYGYAVKYGVSMAVGTKLTWAASAAGVYLLRTLNPQETVTEFLEGLATGADLHKGDTRLRLRDQLRNMRERVLRADSIYHLALLVNCWNEYITQERHATPPRRSIVEFPRFVTMG